MHRQAVYRINAIAIAQSRSRGRRILKSSRYICVDRVANRIVLNGRSDAKIFAALIRLHLVELFLIEIVRMRIQHPQHAHDRRFIDGVVINLIAIDVVFPDNAEGVTEILGNRRGLAARVTAWTPPRHGDARARPGGAVGTSRAVGLVAFLLRRNKSRDKERK